jgi:N-acetylglucosamine malate deacetylase 1
MVQASQNKKKWVALAAVAHPDDIEFVMAGTLLRLKDAGAEIHMWNIANGSCGTATYSKADIIRMRWQEAKDGAKVAGATIHEPICDDLGVFYDAATLAKVGAVIRKVKPDIVLTHSPADYMEDHMNTCRLLVTGVFSRGMPNFATDPKADPVSGNCVVYHALPHGLRDPLRKKIHSGQYVDIAPYLKTKREMLAQHRSQKEWLDLSQGMDAYLTDMENYSRSVGKESGKFEIAEGWRRHLHLGFGPADYDPMKELLGDACWIDPRYEKSLDE